MGLALVAVAAVEQSHPSDPCMDVDGVKQADVGNVRRKVC